MSKSEYQEGGRFGRITKNLRKRGFEDKMDEILYDSKEFPNLKKKEQTEYVETVMERMTNTLGQKNTDDVMFSCGQKCCGKSWAKFAKSIRERSDSLESFFKNLNIEEEKYNTSFIYNEKEQTVIVNRTKCICGLINKGEHFKSNKSFCNCSNGHMFEFFNAVLTVKSVELVKAIFNGDDKCEWIVKID